MKKSNDIEEKKYDKNISIYEFLSKHKEKKEISFHMPGHKGRNLYSNLKHCFDDVFPFDITEIEGADNLFKTEGIIKNTCQKYEKLYGSLKSYILINGTSCGIISSIIACTDFGDKIIMARNCHKSVYNVVKLRNLKPAYLFPKIMENWGIGGEIEPEDVEKAIIKNPDCKLVILPSPNYYGICSQIDKIAEIVHKYNKILIIDQAHGAHLKFFENYDGFLPKSAESQSADIIINSTHKTLGTFTQSAVLNVMSKRIDLDRLEDALQTMESSSPSYLLMLSMDLNANLLFEEKDKFFKEWKENIDFFYDNVKNIRGLEVISDKNMLDKTKINIDVTNWNIDGSQLEKKLIEKGIYPELVTGDIVMCMTGIGNVREDFIKLLEALKEIEKEQQNSVNGVVLKRYDDEEKELLINIMKEKPVMAENIFNDKKGERIHIKDSVGRICNVPIIPYPPGVPIVTTGELISENIIKYIDKILENKRKVMGVDEKKQISVFKI